jgi:chromosome segregation ATPase
MALTIQDFEDLVKLLNEHPEWRERLRSVLFPEWEEFRTAVSELLRESLALQRDVLDALRHLATRLESLTGRVDDLAARLQALTARVDDLAEAQRRTEAQLQVLAARVDDLAARLQALTARVDELAEAQRRTEAQLQVLTARVDDLAAQLQALTARVDDLAAQLQVLAARVDDLTARLQALTARVDDLTVQLQVLTARVDDLAARLQVLAARVDDLAKAQKDLTVRMEELAEILRGLRGEREGEKFEEQVRRSAFGIFRGGRNFRKDVEDALERAIAEGRIDWKTFQRVRATDLLWWKKPQDQPPVLLVAEVSIQVDQHDVDRVLQTVRILTQLFPDLRVIPVVMGRDWSRPEVWEQARLRGVEWWIEKNGACSDRLDSILKARPEVLQNA